MTISSVVSTAKTRAYFGKLTSLVGPVWSGRSPVTGENMGSSPIRGAMNTYTQCALRKGSSEQISFIPTKFANLNKVLKLKDAEGNWDDGWVVVGKGATVDEKHLPDSHSEIKAHRRATGDSMKKSVSRLTAADLGV